ncbi:hypothetical protein ACIG0D_27435 [Streptomyces sp. NPDC052773]|uniref:hypothetical protein n=1 Tax=Streptomyces sp. NPDC052773 TaxID=3365693 RepID=UPI0037CEA5E4
MNHHTPPTEQAALDLDAISARAADAQQYGIEDEGFEQLVREDVPALVAEVRRLRAAVLPPPVPRADVLREAADELGRMDYDADSNDYGYDTYRDAWNGGVMDGAEKLRRMADEAQPAPCAECGHSHAVHRDGDDPVTPGECTACPDDERHDYTPGRGAEVGTC